jgi:WD40 repeat protein
MADLVGQQLGNYRLVRLLGKGGFAEVYQGEHIYLETEAAIKVLHAQLAQDEADHFRNEARTIARLKHPHIVRVLEFGIENSMPYLVMDYAPHGTLRQRHPRGTRLELSVVVSYVKQVAEALQYAHDHKLIHRDVKPENMLLGERHELLLSDFGIAVLSQSSRYDLTRDTTGTIAYMAPEQIQAHPRYASDQYALGVIVYEWLSGDRPFVGSFTEIAAKHLLTPPPPLRTKLPALSIEIEQVVQVALAKDPAQRFGSVAAFATALEQAHQGTSSSHAPSSAPIPSLPTFSDGPSTPVTLSNASMMVSNMPLEPIKAETVVESRQISPPVYHETPLEATARAPLSPDVTTTVPGSMPAGQSLTRRLVLAGAAGLAIAAGTGWWLLSTGNSTLAPQSVDSTSLHTVYTFTGHTAAVHSVAWSPDGTALASGSADITVQIWDATDGKVTTTYKGHTSLVNTVAWSPDGKRIASADQDGIVQVWNAASGTRQVTYERQHFSSVLAVAWAPDGKQIASCGMDGTIQIWNAQDGIFFSKYGKQTSNINAVGWSPDGKRIAFGGNDDLVQVWDVSTTNGQFLRAYEGHSLWVNAVIWSPDGKLIASGSNDTTVQVWNAADGKPIITYKGHTASVYTVAWSPDGKQIASGSGDDTVQIWNAADGKPIATYTGHKSSVYTVAWSPNGKQIASGSKDMTVQIWSMK